MNRPGDECWRIDCTSTDTHPYISGPACDLHAPWAMNRRPDPTSQVNPAATERVLRAVDTPVWAKGATDIQKERPGGYKSRQRAQREAEQRDAVSVLQHPERADLR